MNLYLQFFFLCHLLEYTITLSFHSWLFLSLAINTHDWLVKAFTPLHWRYIEEVSVAQSACVRLHDNDKKIIIVGYFPWYCNGDDQFWLIDLSFEVISKQMTLTLRQWIVWMLNWSGFLNWLANHFLKYVLFKINCKLFLEI